MDGLCEGRTLPGRSVIPKSNQRRMNPLRLFGPSARGLERHRIMQLYEYESQKATMVPSYLRQNMELDDRRILELGPSTGALMEALARLGCEPYGIDIESPWSQYYRYRPDRRLLCNLEYEDPPPGWKGSFELVIAQEVIEHLKRPYDVLGRIRELLTPAGLLFVTTPNLVGLTARIKGERWCGVTTETHYILYTPRSLTFLMSNAGFLPVRVFTNLVPIYWQSKHAWLRPLNRLCSALPVGGGIMGLYRRAQQ